MPSPICRSCGISNSVDGVRCFSCVSPDRQVSYGWKLVREGEWFHGWRQLRHGWRCQRVRDRENQLRENRRLAADQTPRCWCGYELDHEGGHSG